jgi:hypothetical protein
MLPASLSETTLAFLDDIWQSYRACQMSRTGAAGLIQGGTGCDYAAAVNILDRDQRPSARIHEVTL